MKCYNHSLLNAANEASFLVVIRGKVNCKTNLNNTHKNYKYVGKLNTHFIFSLANDDLIIFFHL